MLANNFNHQDAYESDLTTAIQNKAIELLEQFVRLIASHATIEIQNAPEFRGIIKDLCGMGPSVAQAIAGTICEMNDLNSPQEQTQAKYVRPTRKRKPNSDYYRPTKYVKRGVSSDYSNASRNCHLVESEGTTDDDKPPPPLSVGAQNNDAVQYEKDVIVSAADYAAPASTPKPVDRTSTPGTEDTPRHEIPSSPKIAISSRPSTPDQSVAETTSIRELIIEAARTLNRLSKHRDGVPSDVHRRVLRSFQGDPSEALAASTSDQWSDGSTWVQVLEMGSSRQNKVTILNMLEYMGFWEWYDGQLKLTQAKMFTKKGKPVKRRGAATRVLDIIQKRWVGSVGMVTLQDESSSVPIGKSASLTQAERDSRNHIRTQLSRGQKLCTQLVKELGLGILFSRKIWEYTKMESNRLNDLVRNVKANSQHMKLLQILSPQLNQLVTEGSPNLPSFWRDLKNKDLISEDEYQELQGIFPLEHLNDALDRLVEGVSKILQKPTFDVDDTVGVSGSMELPCNIFQRLRPGNWLDLWTIMAAMQISGKPAYIRFDISTPLDEIGADNEIRPIKQPLPGWAKKIAKHRQQAQDSLGTAVPLVYFCPINHRNNHFTLLEIDERKNTIRHYDSKADPDTIQGLQETRISRLVQEEFGDLGFSYHEDPTPQKRDAWSCGIGVIWNFRQLANGLPIGSWDRVLNSEHMTWEIVEGLVTCVKEHVMLRGR